MGHERIAKIDAGPYANVLSSRRGDPRTAGGDCPQETREPTAALRAVLTARYEFRERLWGQRILALYRCGRQSEALAVYQDVRRLLDEHLGIAPGAALRALHQQVLRSDPALGSPGCAPRSSGRPPGTTRRLHPPHPYAPHTQS